MFEPLVWMFYTKDFKKHFVVLLCADIILFLLAVLLIFFAFIFKENGYILIITSLALLLLAFLFLQGYFWELTENVIRRTIDISANNVYTKVKTKNVIQLPDFNIKKIIWRGFSSVVASCMLFIPVILILIGLSITATETISLFKMDMRQIIIMYKGLALFICLFIPALLYNYAIKDSVFAVLNLPKAVYLMGNYPWRYIKNTVLFLIFACIYAKIMNVLTLILGLNFTSIFQGRNIISISGTNILLSVIFLFIITFVFQIYYLYVNSYLLGTIAPREEW